MTAISANDIWAVGDVIEHWDGTSWSVVPGPSSLGAASTFLDGVAAVSTTDVWAVGAVASSGSNGQTLTEHWDGTSWSVVPSLNGTANFSNLLLGVAAVSTTDVWAVGFYVSTDTPQTFDIPLIEQWDGTGWHVVSSANEGTNGSALSAVAVNPAASPYAWAVGDTCCSSTTGNSSTLIESNTPL